MFTIPVIDDSLLTANLRLVTGLNSGTMYYWRVRGKNSGGTGPWSEVWDLSVVITGVEEDGRAIPSVVELRQNYPNPFNPSTSIRFGVPVKTHVRLEVFDILGSRVAILADKEYEAGYHDVVLDAARFSGGVYFYRITTVGFVETRKLILTR
jgi:hypothetical protein